MSPQLKSLSLAFAAGLVCVAGFAPFGLYPLPVVALALLFHLWLAVVAAWMVLMGAVTYYYHVTEPVEEEEEAAIESARQL